MNIYIFSSAILLNSFSMTALMLVCGLAGAPGLTADIAVVQGATLALFYAFSANARNVIFADPTGAVTHVLLRARLALMAPLAAACLVLGSLVGSVNPLLAIVLILRRCSEWVGEISLSDQEVQNHVRPAAFAVIAECSTFVLAVFLIFVMNVEPVAAIVPWSLAPLVPVVTGRIRRLQGPVSLMHNLGRITPNVGSTSIIGITVYVFRLSIILVVGRAVAGDLFTAFAIGSLLSTLYSTSIGPSLVLREHAQGGKNISSWIVGLVCPALFLAGVFVTIISMAYPETATWLRKGHPFWTAVGLSLSGGAVMMAALHRRILMLQDEMNIELFGADVLSNVLIAVSVPYFYYILGARSLEGLYCFNAVLTLCFYWGTRKTALNAAVGKVKLFGIAALVALPVFFQLGGNIFASPAFIFDTGRALNQLPIPVSVFALVGGTIILGRFRDINRSLTVFFLTAIFMVLASLIVQDAEAQAARLILMAQYLLPVLALVLGDMYGAASQNYEFEKTCFIVICVLAPLQLFCSWAQGLFILTPYLYVFSIYQHLTYVPVIFMTIYGSALICLWDSTAKWRSLVACMMPVACLYAAASFSFEAELILFVMTVGGALFVCKRKMPSRRIMIRVIAIAFLAGASYAALIGNPGLTRDSAILGNALKASHEKYDLARVSSPGTLGDRIEQWRFYGKGVLSGTREFFFGHHVYPDRSVHPSAYNYYLDLLYHFGFLSLVPLLVLLGYSAFLAYRFRTGLVLNASLLASVLASFVIFGIDNSFKVGLRQPYPGIFGFFVLGLLQARLTRASSRSVGKGRPHA
jgi:hypothetical protein